MKLSIQNRIKHSYHLRWCATQALRMICKIDPAFDANRNYRHCFGRKMNLKNPTDLIEKIVWMELHTDTSLWTLCEDKYRMRKYLAEKQLLTITPPLLAKWDKAEEITLDALPNQFVIKPNHGCGDVILCHNKSELDLADVRRRMRRAISMPYGYNNAALHYTRIRPCILAEPMLQNDYANISRSMVDFKVMCINGKAEYILIVYDRSGERPYYLDLFDPQWRRMPEHLHQNSRFRFSEQSHFPSPPPCLDKMIAAAEKLAAPFPQIRVDFYIVGGEPILGEFSLFTGYGYFTEAFYKHLGEKLTLPPRMR